MDSVVGVFAIDQHRALAALSTQMQTSYIGLTAAARYARHYGLICVGIPRKCECFDIAAYYSRHAMPEKVAEFLNRLVSELILEAMSESVLGGSLIGHLR